MDHRAEADAVIAHPTSRIVAGLAVVIGGVIWLAVVFALNAVWLIVVFGVVMFVVWRWRFAGEMGIFGRKEARSETPPGWTPPSETVPRTFPGGSRLRRSSC